VRGFRPCCFRRFFTLGLDQYIGGGGGGGGGGVNASEDVIGIAGTSHLSGIL